MNYELAKKLKDAGFPQKYITSLDVREAMDYEENDVVTYPTLSELIKECGSRFTHLKMHMSFKWQAYFDNKHEYFLGNGSTPE